ncbi:hypothetical protein ACF06W_11525 [Streptomyces albus]|uniref:hypothetical protein n=1 Tax=Streptomyces albus TaxID=1888 RepID=UPI0036FD0BA4
MARYVTVNALYPYDRLIKSGPYELDSPDDFVPQEGQRLMLEEDALASGYRYAPGGAAFAPPREAQELTVVNASQIVGLIAMTLAVLAVINIIGGF